jgi:hypothetical protein
MEAGGGCAALDLSSRSLGRYPEFPWIFRGLYQRPKRLTHLAPVSPLHGARQPRLCLHQQEIWMPTGACTRA